jgi:hypothetical protein
VFREFIELADLNSIRVFITTASSFPDGENLKLLWGRAFKEGLIAGHQLYGKTEEKLKVVQAEAYEEGFQAGYNEGQRDTHEDWALDGHGLHCGYRTTVPYDDYGTLPDSIATSPVTTDKKASVSTQTDPPATTTTSVSTQTTSLPTPIIADSSSSPTLTATSSKITTNQKTAVLAPTTSVAVQANPPDTSTTSHSTTNTQTELPATNMNATSPKPPVLNENTTKIQILTTNGAPFSPATHCDEETARMEPPFPPIHDPPHFPVISSPLPALADYISSAQNSSTFENPTTDVVLKPTTPIFTTHKLHTPTVNVPTPENATTSSTTGELYQKPPKPPEITSVLIILHPITIANGIPTSGKDPPHLAKFFYHFTYDL